MNNDVLSIILSAAVPALTIILTWCAKWLTGFLDAKKQEALTKSKNDTVKTYVELVADNAINVVTSLNQTLVEGLKKASEDGKLTLEDANNIKNTAIIMLTDTLSEDIQEVLEETFGDLQSYLSNVIEKTVVMIKNSTLT